MAQEEIATEEEVEKFKISISFVNMTERKDLFKGIKKKFNKYYDLELNHLVQGEPFTWGIRVKNIDNKPTPSGFITLYGIKNLEDSYCLSDYDNNPKALKPLNPDESTVIKLDSDAAFVEGAQWAYALIKPQGENYEFETYQYNAYHDKNTKYYGLTADSANWMDSIYIQKKMELLQEKTNNYILTLTIISVWESIFGIKETLVNILTNAAEILNMLGAGLSLVAGSI
ncbi:hypothetical protein ACEUDP_01640 [Aeromonas caviae]|uniref:hypothetical protein n=1 Tax=Aeromonas caviae TaxID=648 RepID=UPI0038CFB2DF